MVNNVIIMLTKYQVDVVTFGIQKLETTFDFDKLDVIEFTNFQIRPCALVQGLRSKVIQVSRHISIVFV